MNSYIIYLRRQIYSLDYATTTNKANEGCICIYGNAAKFAKNISKRVTLYVCTLYTVQGCHIFLNGCQQININRAALRKMNFLGKWDPHLD